MYLEPCQRRIRWKFFLKLVKGLKPLTVFAKKTPSYIFENVLITPCYASPNYVFRKSSANFTGKTPVLESLFTKAAGPQACNFVKKRIEHRCFTVKFAKFLRASFFTEHPWWLLFRINNSNNPAIYSKIFLQYPLRTTNISSPATFTVTN